MVFENVWEPCVLIDCCYKMNQLLSVYNTNTT